MLTIIKLSLSVSALLLVSVIATGQGLPVHVFEPNPTPTPSPTPDKSERTIEQEGAQTRQVSDKEWKELVKRAEAAKRESASERKTREREEKERWKLPAEIQVTAPAERVRPLLIEAMQREGYFLQEDTAYRMSFSKEVKGFRGALAQALIGNAYSGPPIFEISFVTSELVGTTTIRADMALTIQNAFGRKDRHDFNKDKDSRRNLEGMLAGIKGRAEAP